jgi:hypothetical protein
MLYCLYLLAVRAVALAGANEDIGVEKGGRDVRVSYILSHLVVNGLSQPYFRLVGRRSSQCRY